MKDNIQDLIDKGQIEKTPLKKRITISGENITYDVYRFPLDLLYYNDQNGRINTAYHQFLASNTKIPPAAGDSEYNQLFENFIYNSKKSAMDKTQESIELKGQQEPGVILSDGRIIDGNRRFTALRRIQKKTNIPQYFEAVILTYDITNKIDEKK